MEALEEIFKSIDAINSTDPNLEEWDGGNYPKELLYGQRMSYMLEEFLNEPSPELQIAARGQHIKRWDIPRGDYSMDRKGYLKWRTMLKLLHGELLSEIMVNHKCSKESIEKVVELVTKKKLKTDTESKQLEDVVCLVFLKYYFSDFAQKHDEEKVIDIVKKTWAKMTDSGHDMALKLDYSEKDLAIIKKALA